MNEGLTDLLALFFPFSAGPDLPAVATYSLVGPNFGTSGIASTSFTLTLGDGTLAAPVTFTPNDGGAGGTFGPASRQLTDSVRSATFTYTALVAGVVLIETTNDGGLEDPAAIDFTAFDPITPPIGTSESPSLGPQSGLGRIPRVGMKEV